MTEFGLYLYVTAVGFVAAGILSSFLQLVSGKPPRFNLAPETISSSIANVFFGLVAGPAIVMRNAWLGMRKEARPPFWFGLSAAIAGVWSLFSGSVLLAIILMLIS